MNAKAKSQIKNQLAIAKTNAENFLAYQAGRMTFEEFVELYMKNNETSIGFVPEWSEEWIRNQEFNKLPNRSSGSTFTALTDIDNILTPHFEEDEEAYEYCQALYDRTIHPIVIKGYTN